MPTNFWNKRESIIRSDILVTPAILKMIGDVKGKNILDLGCGDGTISSLVCKKGGKVIGVDKNEVSINLARKKEGKYICNDLDDVDFQKEQFDIIYSSMVFLFLNDKEIKSLIDRIYSWLKKDGIFIFSDIHPTTEIQKGRFTLVKNKIPKNFNYFKTSKMRAILYNLNKKACSFDYYHRSLSKYIELICLKGFHLTALKEPQATPVQVKKYKLIFEQSIPSYIILKFVKGK